MRKCGRARLLFIFLLLSTSTFGQLAEWVKAIDYTTIQVPQNAYLDPSGKSIGVGYYTDSIKIGSDIILNKGKKKFYVSQFGSNGQPVKTFADGQVSINASISIGDVLYDKNGNIILTGTFSADTIQFGAVAYLSGKNGISFLARYSPAGNLLGVPIFYKNCTIEKLTVDQNNMLYCTGSFQDTLDLKDTVLIGQGYLNSFLVKYDEIGNLAWAKTLSSKDMNCASSGGSLLIDKWNSLYWTGYFTGTVEEEGLQLNSIPLSGENMYIVSYNDKGKLKWIKRDGSNTIRPRHALLAADSILVIAGFFQGTSTLLGDTVLPNPPDTASMTPTSYFLASYSTSGRYRWSKVALSPIQRKSMVPTDYGDVIDIAYDGDHAIWITGEIVGNVNVMGTPVSSNSGSVDGFLAECDLNGKTTHVIRTGGPKIEYPYCLSVDSCKNVYMMGFHETSISFNAGTQTNFPSYSYLLTKYSPPVCLLVTANEKMELSAENKIALYPNPAKNTVCVDWFGNDNEMELTLFDITGQKVKEYIRTGHNFTIDLNGILPGLYTVKLKSGNQLKVVRLCVE